MSSESYRYKWLALISVSLLSFTAFLDFTIVSTAMPFIQASFNASVLQLQWVSSIFIMVLSMSMIGVGKLGDIYDRRVIFYIGFIFFGIAAIGAALSLSIYWLIAFRAMQGLGAAIIVTQGAALLPQAFPKEEQHRAIGVYSAITGLGLAIGPFFGGVIISALGWRYIFWVNIPIIIIGLTGCMVALQAKAPQGCQEKFDWLGLVLLVIAIGCSIYGIILGEQAGWNYIHTYIYLVVGVIAFICLLVQERYHQDGLLDLSIFANPQVLLAILTCMCAGLLTCVFLFFNPLYFKIIRHYNAAVIGLLLMAMPICQVILSIFFARLVKLISLTGMLFVAICFSIVGSFLNGWFSSSSPVWFIVVSLACMGVTWGVANAGCLSVVTENLPEHKAGIAIGTIFTCQNVTGAFLLAISTVIFNQYQVSHLKIYLEQHQGDISTVGQHHLSKAIADPDHAASYLHQGGGAINHLYNIFQEGFLSALHGMSWVMTAILVLILIVAITQIRRLKMSVGS